MKTLKKILPFLLVAVILVAMSSAAFAAGGTGTITVQNAAKGETYSIYKVFDATISESQTDGKSDSIAYTFTGDLPASLSGVFEKIGDTDYVQKKEGATDTAIFEALAAYVAGLTPTDSQVAQGGPLEFTDVPYGYYYVTSSLGSTATVTSNNPDAVIYDKNTEEPSADKTVDQTSYSIGDTITYTATFETSNYLGEGENSKQVVEYVISDTLPEFISDVTVTSITIGGQTVTTQQFDADGKITIPWATKNADNTYTSLYDQGAQIIIEYEGTLTSTVNIGTANTNTIEIQPNVDNGSGGKEPWNESWNDSTEIKTYAAAIKKTDGTNPLPGAQFTIQGLVVEKLSDGVYQVVSYDPESTDQSAVLDTDADGKLYIVGLASDVSLTVTEYRAPDGYNLLTETKTLTPQILSTEIITEDGTRYYDADGNLVSEEVNSSTSETVVRNLDDLDAQALEIVNNKGTTLPETGGIGTTIFYIVGAVLVLGAGVILFVRRRMIHEK